MNVHSFFDRIESMRVYLPPRDAGWLKYFAVFFMLIDHFAYAFLERAYVSDGRALMKVLPYGRLLCSVMRAAGRQAFPVFCFFLVEGFYYTRSRIRYLCRLAVFALISQVPFQKCFFQSSNQLHANVMCTLALGFLMIWVIEELRRAILPGRAADGHGHADRSAEDLLRRGLFLAASGGAVYGFTELARALHTDYSYGGVILILILYLLRGSRLTALFISWLWMWWYNSLEMYAAPAFFLLACYNGKRGKQSKYFFYLFYPAHLTILWLLRRHFFGM